MKERYLFRGKRIDTKEWVYGYYFKTPLTDENSGTESEDGWFLFADGKKRHCISDKNGCTYVVIPKTVGLWTTVKDKNNKLVFEGDICRFSSYISGDYNEPESIEIIKFEENSYNGNLLVDYMDHPHWCEIIGNIYDNKNLLEQQK